MEKETKEPSDPEKVERFTMWGSGGDEVVGLWVAEESYDRLLAMYRLTFRALVLATDEPFSPEMFLEEARLEIEAKAKAKAKVS